MSQLAELGNLSKTCRRLRDMPATQAPGGLPLGWQRLAA